MSTDPVVERAVKIIAEAIRPQKIILFGSRAMGTARPDSDLDLVNVRPSFPGLKKSKSMRWH